MSSAESTGSLRIPGTKIEAVTGKVVKLHAQLGAHHWVNNALENEIVCVLGLLPSCKCKLGQVKKINKITTLFTGHLLNTSIHFEQSALCFRILLFDLHVKKPRIESLKKYINCNARVTKEECLNWCTVLVVQQRYVQFKTSNLWVRFYPEVTPKHKHRPCHTPRGRPGYGSERPSLSHPAAVWHCR